MFVRTQVLSKKGKKRPSGNVHALMTSYGHPKPLSITLLTYTSFNALTLLVRSLDL